MTTSDYVTKQDLNSELESFYGRIEDMVRETILREVPKIVGDQVGEIANDILQLMNDRFDIVEDKLDRTIARIDLHDVDIRELRRKLV